MTAKIANINHTTTTTIVTLIIAPIDYIKAQIITFIAALWLMNLKGLMVLNNQRILITGKSIFVKLISIIEVTTIKKSS